MGLQPTALLKHVPPTTRVLLFTDHDLAAESAREPAIDGYLSKRQVAELLPTILRLLASPARSNLAATLQ
jgi:hypothetical protein